MEINELAAWVLAQHLIFASHRLQPLAQVQLYHPFDSRHDALM
jgi:hypothetical protein